MNDRFAPRALGRTGLTVGPLGISASYGVPAAAVEKAFEAGFTYLYWGSVRRGEFAKALRALAPRRDRLVFVIQSYARAGLLLRASVERALRRVGYDHADILLLGWWNHDASPRVLDAARALRDRGLVRHLAISTHNRRIAPGLGHIAGIDVLHVRYNAAHPGAEEDLFPRLPAADGPGLVAFTATSWGQLLRARWMPPGEPTPTAGDCYRFVLSNPAVGVCLTGPATSAHVDHAIAAIERGPMSADELAWMKRVGRAVRRRAILGRT